MTAHAWSRFGVLVPVKPARVAKSRLGALGEGARRDLALALALDTVAAALGSPLVVGVLVVTDDHSLAASLRASGADVLPDGASDLNESLVAAGAELHRRDPGLAVAALCADLPALRSDELTSALEVAASHPGAYVPDHEGSGTTMVTALTSSAFRPRFGPGSSAAHRAAGLHEIVEVSVPTLRRDVDTPADLAQAVTLGVGVRTRQTLDGIRL